MHRKSNRGYKPHADSASAARNFFSEVKEAIRNSEIIEEYPNDYPYPSCLLLGITLQNRIIHIVVGLGETKLWLITAYEPDPIKWSADFKVRKD